MARAKQDLFAPTPGASPRFSVLSLLIHGDAAFAGQGVVAETLNLSMLPGYRTGGTVHLVINNQVGFTTAPESARSSVYATDVAKMVQAPIFHVNGDDPEACVRVAKLAFAFRQEFEKDVVIDMVCYRRFGHNEGDEPSYTQPQMYERIEQKRSVRKLYTEALVKRGDITMEEAEQALDDFSARLQAALDETRQSAPPKPTSLPAPPPTIVEPSPLTGVAARRARPGRRRGARRSRRLHRAPEAGHVSSKPGPRCTPRARSTGRSAKRWRSARCSSKAPTCASPGQDTRRGTFSHRHAVLVDYHTGIEYVPLWELGPDQGRFFIYDSLLSRVRRARLRVRLLGRAQGRAGRVGSAVRRLHERRADHHRPVHRRGRGQVGPDLRPRVAAAPRLRGPGPRAQLGAPRAVPHAVRRGQHDASPADHRGAVLPPAAPPGAPRPRKRRS